MNVIMVKREVEKNNELILPATISFEKSFIDPGDEIMVRCDAKLMWDYYADATAGGVVLNLHANFRYHWGAWSKFDLYSATLSPRMSLFILEKSYKQIQKGMRCKLAIVEARDTTSAINVCAKTLKDEQLALVIFRILEGYNRPSEDYIISMFLLVSVYENDDSI
ncbi:hypothetical protein L1887_15037 [Cichorium endivia]|nr:hypothetical protein L1887_15037 [Cichorium endivia]